MRVAVGVSTRHVDDETDTWPPLRPPMPQLLLSASFFDESFCRAPWFDRRHQRQIVQSVRLLTAGKHAIVRLRHQQHATSDRFIAHMLSRNIRIEEDLIDQFLNSSEKRLARTLLLLARMGTGHPGGMVPMISQANLADMIGRHQLARVEVAESAASATAVAHRHFRIAATKRMTVGTARSSIHGIGDRARHTPVLGSTRRRVAPRTVLKP